MITKRDLEVIDFVTRMKVATTSCIYEIFYPTSSRRYCQHRLAKLYHEGELNRDRKSLTSEYVYFKKKPKQFVHCLLRSEFYKELNKRVKIIRFATEYTCEDIRADAYIKFQKKEEIGTNKGHLMLLEVEISNNKIDKKLESYQKLYETGKYKNYFPVMPMVLFLTNKTVPKVENLSLARVDIDFSNIGKYF